MEKYLSRIFIEIVLSGDLGVVKPNPEIYNATLQKLAVSSTEAIFVDDRPVNVDAGNRLLLWLLEDIASWRMAARKPAFDDNWFSQSRSVGQPQEKFLLH